MRSKLMMRRMEQNWDLTRKSAAHALASQSYLNRQRAVPVAFAISPTWTARVTIGRRHCGRRNGVSYYVSRSSHKTSHGTRALW
jgi:hypothetical protein